MVADNLKSFFHIYFLLLFTKIYFIVNIVMHFPKVINKKINQLFFIHKKSISYYF
nr:MAG TPA: hypothetical protein [Caudoviricetes sp.]